MVNARGREILCGEEFIFKRKAKSGKRKAESGKRKAESGGTDFFRGGMGRGGMEILCIFVG